MTAHAPPVPPDQQPKQGGPGKDKAHVADATRGGSRDPNTAEQSRQGNIKQNTTNKGYQQDR